MLEQQGAQPRVRRPGNHGEPQNGYGHDGSFAASPSNSGPEKEHGHVDTPGEERDFDLGLADPDSAHFDKGPGAGGDDSQGYEYEADGHGLGDQVVERTERGQ